MLKKLSITIVSLLLVLLLASTVFAESTDDQQNLDSPSINDSAQIASESGFAGSGDLSNDGLKADSLTLGEEDPSPVFEAQAAADSAPDFDGLPAAEQPADTAGDAAGAEQNQEPVGDEETDAVPDTLASAAEENEECAEADPGIIDPYFYSSGGKQEYDFLLDEGAEKGAQDDFKNQSGKGFIFIERGFVHDGADIDINPDDHPNLTGLVFQDYYPKEGSGFDFDPFDTTYWPVINANITVSRMPSGFTLIGLVINGAVTFEDCIGQLNLTYLEISNPDGDGITIQGTDESNSYSHRGNVIVDNVKSNNNYGYGAYIDNWHSGNVTITSSEFNGNGIDYTPEDPEPHGTGVYNGLEIWTQGVVTIDGITASHNNGTGLEVYDFSRLTMKNSAFMGNSNDDPDDGEYYGGGFLADSDWRNAPVILDFIYAHNNGHYGARIKTGGAVTITNLFTNGNEFGGVYVDNSFGKGNVIFNTGHFYGNSWAGLLIKSNGAVTLNSMRAFNNLGGGVIIYALGNVTVTSPAAAGEAGTNAMGFNGEWDDDGVVEPGANGLEIHSKGHVVVTNLNSFNNSANGLYVRNDYDGAAGNVTINTNIPGFNNGLWSNSGSGVFVRTNGNLVVTDTSAGNNERYGLQTYYDDNPEPENLPREIIPAKAVTITRGWFNDNADNGLIVFATGNIVLTDVTARGNGHRGPDGFYSGAVLINGIFYYEADGEVIYNFPGGNGTVTVKSSAADIYNNFEDNSGNGLSVFSNGVVSLTNIEASRNSGGSGVYIYNIDAPSAKAVTLTKMNLGDNAKNGLQVFSRGAITLTDLNAERNGLTGVDLNNDGLSSGNVTLTRGSIRENGWTDKEGEGFDDASKGGIHVNSRGAVTLVDVNVEHNNHDGVYIKNDGGTGNVTIRAAKAGNTYNYNHNGIGINIETRGVVAISDVNVSNNYDAGIRVINDGVGRAVNLTRTFVRENGWGEYAGVPEGILIEALGPITLIDVLSENNGGTGALLDSSGGSGGVTIRSSKADNFYHFSRNEQGGLEISSGGAVQLNNVIADWNRGGPGALIVVNKAAGTKGTVRVTLSNFRSNEGIGLEIVTLGAVTLDRVEAGHNTVRNFWISDEVDSARFDQRLSWDMDGARYYFNNSDSDNENLFELDTYGFEGGLKLFKFNEDSGEYEELYFNNKGTWDDPWTNTTILDYQDDKLEAGDYMLLVSTSWWGGHSGEYTLFFNGEDEAYGKFPYYGAYIDASSAAVTVSGTPARFSKFFDNNVDGLYIKTTGHVTITNVDAHDNGGSGIYIEGGNNVTLRNTSRTTSSWISNNNGDGFAAEEATGVITVSGNMNLNNNRDYGVILNNRNAPGQVDVNLSGFTSSDNGQGNVNVQTKGNIKLSNLVAESAHDGVGVYLNNTWDADKPGKTITISGRNRFNYNQAEGLFIEASGAVTVSGVLAEGNGADGIVVVSHGDGGETKRSRNITLQDITAHYNDGIGIVAETNNGTITVTGVSANLNRESGLYADASGQAIRFTNSSFVANAVYGIHFKQPYDLKLFKNTVYVGNGKRNLYVGLREL